MENMPNVTVVIPAYNHADYLREAIDSVLAQTYRDFEILVVDDGSTDHTPDVVPQNHLHIRYLRQENRGLSAARNSGIAAAKGRIISILDADDRFEPAFLETLVRFLEETPGADAVYCGYRYVDQENSELPYSSARTVPPSRLFQTLIYGNFMVPACMVAYKTCYDKAGPFDASLTASEDWDMWLRFAKLFTVYGIPEKLVRYRIVTGSMSSDPERMLRNRHVVLAKHLATAVSVNRDRAYGETYLRATVEYLQRSDQDNALRRLQRLSQVAPSLLSTERVFYELASACQPRGFNGDPRTLDLHRSQLVLVQLLDDLFAGGRAKKSRRATYASAYFALGKLSYAADLIGESTRHLLRSIGYDPRMAGRTEVLLTLLKCLFLLTIPQSRRRGMRSTPLDWKTRQRVPR
jgi:glycosyltransferase involved in cell wall biosynthesis